MSKWVTGRWDRQSNKCVFSSRRNSKSDSLKSRRWSGRLFHRSEPVAVKDRSPRVVRVRGTSQVATLDDRGRRRPVVVMSWQSSTRYCGDRPFSALYTRTAILNSMHCRTGIQWSGLNNGVMCSHRRVPLTLTCGSILNSLKMYAITGLTADLIPNVREIISIFGPACNSGTKSTQT